MPAGKQNITIEQQATFTLRLFWRNQNRTPINLTGCSAKLQLRKLATDQTPAFEFSTDNARIAIAPLNGVIALLATDEDTAMIPAAVYLYDLIVTFPDGSKRRLIEGKATVTAGVTR